MATDGVDAKTMGGETSAGVTAVPGAPAAAGADRALETKERILKAALEEFAAEGLAGARMERLAAAAGVNKALLYYYFESKEKLYDAAVELSAAEIRDKTLALFLDKEASAGEKLLRAALGHFDRILAQQEFQSLMQQEMTRLHKGESSAAETIVKKVFIPVITVYQALVREGVASGELVPLDWLQIHLSSLGANVFYFLSAPIWRMILNRDPFMPEDLQARRWGLVEFLGWAIFSDREYGLKLAKKVFEDTPMPEAPVGGVCLGRAGNREQGVGMTGR